MKSLKILPIILLLQTGSLFGDWKEWLNKDEEIVLTCPQKDINLLPVKFKFSENKNNSWIFLKNKWVSLETKKDENYFYLKGLVITRCETDVKFQYILDRSSLRLYKIVIGDYPRIKYCPVSPWVDGESIGNFEETCSFSKTKF